MCDGSSPSVAAISNWTGLVGVCPRNARYTVRGLTSRRGCPTPRLRLTRATSYGVQPWSVRRSASLPAASLSTSRVPFIGTPWHSRARVVNLRHRVPSAGRHGVVSSGRSMDAPHPVKRRVRAAYILASEGPRIDYAAIADRIATAGLGARTLRKLQDENDPRQPRPWE